MKKIKYLITLFVLPILMSGCFKRDTIDQINILTTTYPIQYLVDNMYGYNSSIASIYPNGIYTKSYELTEKQLKEYANNTMFIYNGLTKEKNTAAKLLEENQSIKLIDAAKGISIQRDEEELWLSPSNYLMLAQNIKTSLEEYSSSTITKQEIENKYEEIKLTISKYDAELKLIAENATNKTIIVGNDVFKFLEKYGFSVLSIENNDLLINSELNEAKNIIVNTEKKDILILDTDEEDENVNKLVALGGNTVKIKSMINLTDEEAESQLDYEQMMETMIETIKNEVYN